MKHPPCRFAAPPSLAPSAWRGAHPEAWQSQFLGCPGLACSAAIGSLSLRRFHVMRVARCAMEN